MKIQTKRMQAIDSKEHFFFFCLNKIKKKIMISLDFFSWSKSEELYSN